MTSETKSPGRLPAFFIDYYFWTGFVSGTLILSLGLWYGFGMDQSICAYAGWLWKQYHLAPYVGIWDMSFPGIFIIYRVALSLFGNSIIAVRIFDLLVQLAGLPLFFYLARRLSGSRLAGSLAMLFYSIFYYGSGNMDSAQRETFVFCALLAALALAFALRDRAWLRAVLVGLFSGFAFLIKPTYGLAWLVFGILLLAQSLKSKPGRRLAELAVFSLSCLLPSIAIIIYYLHLGRLEDLYRATLWFNFKIYGVKGPAPYGAGRLAFLIVRHIFAQQIMVIYPALFGIAVCAGKKSSATRALFWTLLGLIAVGLVSYRFQNKYFPFHLFPFWGFMIIFAAAGTAWLAELLAKARPAALGKMLSALLIVAAITAMVLTLKPARLWYALHYSFRPLDKIYSLALGPVDDPHHAADQYLAAQYLKPLLKPGDSLNFFGPYPLLPFLLSIRLPTRFVCAQHFLFMPADGKPTLPQMQWMEEYRTSVLESRPRFFILADHFPGQSNAFLNLSSRSLHQAFTDLFPDLQTFLNQNYQPRIKIGDLEIYELKAGASGK